GIIVAREGTAGNDDRSTRSDRSPGPSQPLPRVRGERPDSGVRRFADRTAQGLPIPRVTFWTRAGRTGTGRRARAGRGAELSRAETPRQSDFAAWSCGTRPGAASGPIQGGSKDVARSQGGPQEERTRVPPGNR